MHRERWTKAAGLLLMFAALSTASGGARAQSGPLTAEASQKADDLFRKGKDLYKSDKAREAYEAYRGAWALKQSYDIAANLANVELFLGMKRDAADHYAYCLRTFAVTGGKERRDAVKKKFDEARQEVGALLVKVSAVGAEVLIDGKSVGRAPLKDEVYVEPGARMVEARLIGHESAKQSVQVVKGAPTQAISLTLVEVPGKDPLTAGMEPGATGKPDGGGTGKVDAGKPEGGTGSQGSRPSIITPPPGRRGGPSVPLVIGGAALGVVMIGTGIGLGVAAQGKGADADALLEKVRAGSPCTSPPQAGMCQELLSLRQGHDGLHDAFVGMVVSGVVVGAATAGYVLWTRSKQERPASVRAAPLVGPGVGGVFMSGTF